MLISDVFSKYSRRSNPFLRMLPTSTLIFTVIPNGLISVDAEPTTDIEVHIHVVSAYLVLIQNFLKLWLGTLIRRLLERAMKERGLFPGDVNFNTTGEESYISYAIVSYSRRQWILIILRVNQLPNPLTICNITQDNNVIAMAVAPCLHRPPAFSIGIDGMKFKVPRNVQVFRRSFSSAIRP